MIGLQIASGDPSDKHTGHRDPGGASSLGHHNPVIGGPGFRQQTCHGRESEPGLDGQTDTGPERDKQAVANGQGSRDGHTAGHELMGQAAPKPRKGRAED